MMISLLTLWAYLSASSAVSVDDVLDMFAVTPAAEFSNVPGHWERAPHAKEIADAIATVADSNDQAAELAVYAVFEGGLRGCVSGDHGAAWGPMQLQGVSRAVACSPELAMRHWLTLAEASRKHCASLPPDDQLAELTSGSCGHGRVVARRRAALARKVALSIGEE